jgi:hypothetical protein
VRERKPASLLAVTPHANTLFAEGAAQPQPMRITRVEGSEIIKGIGGPSRYEMGFVDNTLEHMDKASARIVISRLRDLYCRILYLALPMGTSWRNMCSHWEHAEMVALGLRLVSRYRVNEDPVHLYVFDIHNYRKTPDWLNSRYWANPEMWDKTRW